MRRRARSSPGACDKPAAASVKLALARAMRAAPTRGEAALWAVLRGRRLDGWKFRRQQVIAGYITDFDCAELWLAVEVDGPVHEARAAQDRERDAHLAALGVRTMRIHDADVCERLDGVVDAIARRCDSIAAALAPRRSVAGDDRSP